MHRVDLTLTSDQYKRYKGMDFVFIPYRTDTGLRYRKVILNHPKQRAFYWSE